MLPKLYTFTSDGGEERKVLAFHLGGALDHLQQTRKEGEPLPLYHYTWVSTEEVEVPKALVEARNRRIAQASKLERVLNKLKYARVTQHLYAAVDEILREE